MSRGLHPILAIGVVVPAHDEADHIGDAIDALQIARRRLPEGIVARIVVVADACNDSTPVLARWRLPAPHDLVVETSEQCVGSARRLGVGALRRILHVPAERLWLASTDADSTVAPDWLVVQLEMAVSGHVAVAGTVQLAGDSSPELRAGFDRMYRIEHDGTHGHVHGANLGLRADIYDLAGGWGSDRTGEEHDLWRRIHAVGHRPTSTAQLLVATSARLKGRAPSGFANDLARVAGDAA